MSQPTMTAAVAPTYGPPSVFELQQIPVPTIATDQLLVRVRATCVNPADAKQRSGNLKLVMKHAFPLVLGQDFAGVVEQVGARCTRFKVGDEVFGSTAPRNSCSAELVAVYERETQPKPAHLSWNEAAAAPTVVATAYRGVVTHGRAAKGQRVLVLGAAGGVGHVMVQLLRRRGCQVWGTCSPRNKPVLLNEYGVETFDYDSHWEAHAEFRDDRGRGSLDLVLDAAGGEENYRKGVACLRKGGRYVSAVGPVLHGGSEPITYGTLASTAGTLLPRFAFDAFRSTSYKLYLGFDVGDLGRDELATWLATTEQAQQPLKLRLDPTAFTLATLGDAHAKVETGHSDGKLVIVVSA